MAKKVATVDEIEILLFDVVIKRFKKSAKRSEVLSASVDPGESVAGKPEPLLFRGYVLREVSRKRISNVKIQWGEQAEWLKRTCAEHAKAITVVEE
ncbi:MAG TPA: hypothetical protein PKE12_06600 [Kiritimatiellia bacterium]|nr:hypothetical protein [Kiritimatiellia bacterium]